MNQTGLRRGANMAKSRYGIFYLEMAKGQVNQGELPIYRVARELPIPNGSVQIYYAFFPQYRKRSFFRKKLLEWKRAEARKCLDELEGRAMAECGCRELLFARDFEKESGEDIQQELPLCLWQAWLHAQRPFDTLCITPEWDGGMYAVEQLLELIQPYLPRLKSVVFMGEENSVSENLKDYLYEEYGMILLFVGKIPEGAVVLQKAKAWKFLDATVKNGYNTLVH